MNKELESFARKSLRAGLLKCTEEEKGLFKRMYSHRNLEKDIDEIVNCMDVEKLDYAMTQVSNTIKGR